MEVLHKEDVLADFMCVGAKFPTLKKEQPISSRHLVMNKTGTKIKLHCTVYGNMSPLDNFGSVFKMIMVKYLKSFYLVMLCN